MGSNVISEELKVPPLLFSMEHNSVLESTNAAFRTRAINALKWTDVTSDLIAEWKSVRKEKFSQLSSSSRPKLCPISHTVTTKHSDSMQRSHGNFVAKRVALLRGAISISTLQTVDFLIKPKRHIKQAF